MEPTDKSMRVSASYLLRLRRDLRVESVLLPCRRTLYSNGIENSKRVEAVTKVAKPGHDIAKSISQLKQNSSRPSIKRTSFRPGLGRQKR